MPESVSPAGPDEYGATYVGGVLTMVQPFDGRPRASKVLTTDSAHVVVFAFAAGQVLREHAAHHAVVITCLDGHVRFGYGDRLVDLHQGDLIHLPPGLRHHVDAVDDSVVSVTMLVTDGS